MVNEAAVATMATPAAAGTKVTKDQLTYVIKQCPMDADCKGLSWNKKKSGYTKDEAIRNFKEHLCHTHGIKDPSVVEDICDRLKFECYIGKQKVSEPSPPQPPVEVNSMACHYRVPRGLWRISRRPRGRRG